MKAKNKLLLAAMGALALASTGANAESTYGYNSAGAGTVTATARINLSIVVPKVVVLRVGQAGGYGAATDVMSWAVRVAIPAAPVNVDGNATVVTSGNSQGVTWNGVAPTISVVGAAPTTNAWAWTNGSNVTLNCSATLSAGGPTLADITGAATATAGTQLDHPGGTLNACTATAALTAGTLYDATWTYTLDTTNAATWAPGAYTGVVTYTASGT